MDIEQFMHIYLNTMEVLTTESEASANTTMFAEATTNYNKPYIPLQSYMSTFGEKDE